MALVEGGGGAVSSDRDKKSRGSSKPASVAIGAGVGSGSATTSGSPRGAVTPEVGQRSMLTPFSAEVPVPPVTVPGPESGQLNYYTERDPGGLQVDGSWNAWGAKDKVDGKGGKDDAPKPEIKQYKDRAVREMTWERYNSLSERQRAAVDFNTALVAAREKDLNSDYDPTKKDTARYEAAVTDMFGEQGGSATFAPETMALLRKIDYSGAGKDLDDFLGLKSAITRKELKGLDIDDLSPVEKGASGVANAVTGLGVVPTDSRSENAILADSTRALQETMAKAGEMLKNWTVSSTAMLNRDVYDFGGLQSDLNVGRGFGNAPVNYGAPGVTGNVHTFFQDAFNQLSSKANGPEQIQQSLGILNETLKPKEQESFLRYVDDLTRTSQDFDLPLGKDRRSAREIRALLNMDGG